MGEAGGRGLRLRLDAVSDKFFMDPIQKTGRRAVTFSVLKGKAKRDRILQFVNVFFIVHYRCCGTKFCFIAPKLFFAAKIDDEFSQGRLPNCNESQTVRLLNTSPNHAEIFSVLFISGCYRPSEDYFCNTYVATVGEVAILSYITVKAPIEFILEIFLSQSSL